MRYESFKELLEPPEAFQTLTFVLDDGSKITASKQEDVLPGPERGNVAYLTVTERHESGDEARRVRFELEILKYVELGAK